MSCNTNSKPWRERHDCMVQRHDETTFIPKRISRIVVSLHPRKTRKLKKTFEKCFGRREWGTLVKTTATLIPMSPSVLFISDIHFFLDYRPPEVPGCLWLITSRLFLGTMGVHSGPLCLRSGSDSFPTVGIHVRHFRSIICPFQTSYDTTDKFSCIFIIFLVLYNFPISI